MQALGLIETKGLIAAVESADVMLKAADVSLLERTFVGGGLVTVTVTGDVAAVKAAVEAASAAVKKLSPELLLSEHVIPRPHETLENVVVFPSLAAEVDLQKPADYRAEVLAPEEETVILRERGEADIHKEDLDATVCQDGWIGAIEQLKKLRVQKLRSLAREYKEFGIAGRVISKADKKQLLTEFEKHYMKTEGKE